MPNPRIVFLSASLAAFLLLVTGALAGAWVRGPGPGPAAAVATDAVPRATVEQREAQYAAQIEEARARIAAQARALDEANRRLAEPAPAAAPQVAATDDGRERHASRDRRRHERHERHERHHEEDDDG